MSRVDFIIIILPPLMALFSNWQQYGTVSAARHVTELKKDKKGKYSGPICQVSYTIRVWRRWWGCMYGVTVINLFFNL